MVAKANLQSFLIVAKPKKSDLGDKLGEQLATVAINGSSFLSQKPRSGDPSGEFQESPRNVESYIYSSPSGDTSNLFCASDVLSILVPVEMDKAIFCVSLSVRCLGQGALRHWTFDLALYLFPGKVGNESRILWISELKGVISPPFCYIGVKFLLHNHAQP
ncbi:hypothetical protein AVEN_51450-1 [Araneus ventricosus]|uniref:Uncharacterized protein n=1 Tax=Araneus ventricosus TaxID=182803 RepID=A0A4Y2KCW2_ARAVE|nr:hypothetical protein AVEN_51450-1 [Araneus ventricosus]